MNEVKWIKISTDMFDNRKIKHIRRLPDGDSIALIWVMLLTMAGKCNSDGMIYVTEDIPYTVEMLADELGYEEELMERAISSLESLGMLTMTEDFIDVAGWNEYQNLEGMEKIREQNKLRKRNQREREKNDNVTCHALCHVMSRDSHATDIEEDIDIKRERDKKEKSDCQAVVDLYNETCVSLPSVKSMSDSRKRAINARLKKHTLDDFKKLFNMAQESEFLKGNNPRRWTANFDWLIKDANFEKVIEGNYRNKGKPPNQFNQMESRNPVSEEELERMIGI